MTSRTFSRRELLETAAVAGLAPLVLQAGDAVAGEAEIEKLSPSWNGFTVGEIQAAIISDGALGLGDPVNSFVGIPAELVRSTLRDNFLDEHTVTLDENALLIDTGSRLVLFDTGTGGNPMLGDKAGRLMTNLKAAGVDPSAVDDVILSHGHPDHIFGLSDKAGASTFDNAQIHIAESDYDYFSNDNNVADPKIGAFIPALRRQLLAVRDRLTFYKDGGEVVPGVIARAAPGHTVGHHVFIINSGNSALIYAADLAHHAAIFTRHPEVNFNSDMDPQQMAETRKTLFDWLATDRLKFVGYHFPFPGAGHLVKAVQGYDFIPASLDTI
jgi:glyoxylase-like metal-dependent hydrolase (beta-lactamase superfamily II)